MKYKIISVNLGLLFVFCVAVFGFSGALAITEKCVEASSAQRKIPIYSVETDEKKIAVTFDAAWSDHDTAQLMEILDKYTAKATFFCVGDYVRKYPQAVKTFYDNGHEIGNHSDTHKLYTQATTEEIKKELTACNEEIKKITKKEPTVCRVPSGAYDNKSIEAAKNLGMATIQWDIDSRDWKKLTVDEMYESIIKNTKNGSIILFHNGIENTPPALDKILCELSKQGYKFVTVSELIYKDNFIIDNQGRQIRIEK